MEYALYGLFFSSIYHFHSLRYSQQQSDCHCCRRRSIVPFFAFFPSTHHLALQPPEIDPLMDTFSTVHLLSNQPSLPVSSSVYSAGSSSLLVLFYHSTEDSTEVDKESTGMVPKDYPLQWSQWQLLDSILPTGGFAHSFGLEAAIQARIIMDPEDFKIQVIHILENTGSLLLPFVYSATISSDLNTWKKLDKILDATLTNEVSRKASIAQGSALMRVAAAVFTEVPSLKTMRDTCLGSGMVSFHHAPVFGLVCGLLGMDSEVSQRAYMFITLRDAFSAATRLNLVGPLGAAVLQHQLSLVAETILRKWMDHTVEEACQTAPLLDIIQGCHSYLFSRLFCS